MKDKSQRLKATDLIVVITLAFFVVGVLSCVVRADDRINLDIFSEPAISMDIFGDAPQRQSRISLDIFPTAAPIIIYGDVPKIDPCIHCDRMKAAFAKQERFKLVTYPKSEEGKYPVLHWSDRKNTIHKQNGWLDWGDFERRWERSVNGKYDAKPEAPKAQKQVMTAEDGDRAWHINHLLSGVHAGGFSLAQLESMSLAQLQAAHYNDHQNRVGWGNQHQNFRRLFRGRFGKGRASVEQRAMQLCRAEISAGNRNRHAIANRVTTRIMVEYPATGWVAIFGIVLKVLSILLSLLIFL